MNISLYVDMRTLSYSRIFLQRQIIVEIFFEETEEKKKKVFLSMHC